jgi:hypothetical protein
VEITVAEAPGTATMRQGRIPIRSYDCWETPVAFAVCHQGYELLFSREEDERGGWSPDYIVRARPRLGDAQPRGELSWVAKGGWVVLGRAPVGALRFEHDADLSYVRRGSLERALATLGAYLED